MRQSKSVITLLSQFRQRWWIYVIATIYISLAKLTYRLIHECIAKLKILIMAMVNRCVWNDDWFAFIQSLNCEVNKTIHEFVFDFKFINDNHEQEFVYIYILYDIVSCLVIYHIIPNNSHLHDDVIKWKRFPHVSPLTGEFPSQMPVKRSLMFSFICAWINS